MILNAFAAGLKMGCLIKQATHLSHHSCGRWWFNVTFSYYNAYQSLG